VCRGLNTSLPPQQIQRRTKIHLEQTTTQQQSFYGPLSGTTRVSRYQKTHHPDHHPVFISFFHLPRSIASSLFKLRAWQSFCTTSPRPFWSTSWSGALQLMFRTFTWKTVVKMNDDDGGRHEVVATSLTMRLYVCVVCLCVSTSCCSVSTTTATRPSWSSTVSYRNIRRSTRASSLEVCSRSSSSRRFSVVCHVPAAADLIPPPVQSLN